MENEQNNVSDPGDLGDPGDPGPDAAAPPKRDTPRRRRARRRSARRPRFKVVRGEIRGAFTAAGEVIGAWREDGSRAYSQLARRVRKLRRRRTKTEQPEEIARRGREPGAAASPLDAYIEQLRNLTVELGGAELATSDDGSASLGQHHAQALAAQAERAGRAERQREDLQAELESTRQRLAAAEAFAERCRNLEAQFSWELLDMDSDYSEA